MANIGLSLPPFSMAPCADGFVVDCKGYHLTVIFEEARISAHLTRNSDGEKLGRAQVTLQELESASEYFTQILFSQIRKARVKDLYKKGYWLSYDPDNLMEGVFKNHSPLRKKKFRPNLPAIIEGLSESEHVEKIFHRPSILCSTNLRRDVPMFGHARSKKGRPKRPQLGFFYAPFPGHEGWYVFNAQSLADPMKLGLLPMLVQKFGEFGKMVSEKMDLENSLSEMLAALKGKAV